MQIFIGDSYSKICTMYIHTYNYCDMFSLCMCLAVLDAVLPEDTAEGKEAAG